MIYIISHKNSKVCDSLGNLFRRSFADNKCDVQHVRIERIDDHPYKSGDVCIIIGAGRFPEFHKKQKKKGVTYALWQTEMLPTTNAELENSKIAKYRLTTLEKVLPYYDYYFEHYRLHIPFMKNRGWTVHDYIPLGYHSSLDYTTKFDDLSNKWDALFVGSVYYVDRRKKQLQLINECCNLRPSTAAWDDEYYKAILQSRIGLNIHFENINTFESWRIMNLMCNKRLVISEPILNSQPLISGKHFISAEPKKFPSVVCKCAKNFDKYQPIAEAGYKFIKKNLKFNDATKIMIERLKKGSRNVVRKRR